MYKKLFVLFFIAIVIGDQNVAEDTLVLVHVVVRHGERTPDPITNFPTEWHTDKAFYPYGMGELNKEGKIHTYQVGKQLRQRYKKFLNTTVPSDNVYALSSGYTRCRMTMQVLLAAMFPPDPSLMFETGLSWQPISYKYIDLKTDKLICTFRTCPNLVDGRPDDSKPNLTYCENRTFMYKYLTQHSGLTVNSLKSILLIQDKLKSQLDNGIQLPLWARSIWPEPLLTCSNDLWRYFLDNKTRLAQAGGTFMKKIVDYSRDQTMENLISKKTKVFLYSVHDYNVYIFLKMIGNYNDIILNYLAYLLFEVHHINGVYGFKIFLDNRDGFGLRQLVVADCGGFCPIDDFYELMKVYFNVEPC